VEYSLSAACGFIHPDLLFHPSKNNQAGIAEHQALVFRETKVEMAHLTHHELTDEIRASESREHVYTV
jgi:hypothetical protein